MRATVGMCVCLRPAPPFPKTWPPKRPSTPAFDGVRCEKGVSKLQRQRP